MKPQTRTESNNQDLNVAEKVILAIILILCPFLLLGMLLEGILVIIGVILAISGITEARASRVPTTESWSGNFRKELSDIRFVIILLFACCWFLVFMYNLLTYPPYGPWYYIREAELMRIHPEVPVEDLPTKSTFGFFGLLMDTSILMIFGYVIYIRFKPGRQKIEGVVNSALERSWFIIVLLISSVVHIVGHLPQELYGRGQWGTGYESWVAWFGYDKFAHILGSMVITMLFASFFTKYFSDLGVRSKWAHIFVLCCSVAFMMLVGVVFEFLEWSIDYVLNLGHFVDEILDTPKDLVWDFGGALIGALLSHFDLRNLPATKKILAVNPSSNQEGNQGDY